VYGVGLHPKNRKLHEASLHEINNEVIYFTKLHLTSFNELMDTSEGVH
jgi:hypothetical protein